MTGKIFKFILFPLDEVTPSRGVYINQNCEFLEIAIQDSNVCLWTFVPIDFIEEEKEMRHFRIYRTGHMIDNDKLEYLATVHDNNLGYVWHIFEEQQ